MYAVKPPRHQSHRESWRAPRHFTSQALPTGVRHWLLDSGSLTRRLVRSSGGEFRVHVICHDWQRPRRSEAKLLGMHCRQWGIVREVALICHDQPWVFARSVIPAHSLRGRLRRLRRFADSSLGELLFRDVSMRRHGFEIARIDGQSTLIPAFLRQSAFLWSRRCRFELAGHPILVSETFLSAFRAR